MKLYRVFDPRDAAVLSFLLVGLTGEVSFGLCHFLRSTVISDQSVKILFWRPDLIASMSHTV